MIMKKCLLKLTALLVLCPASGCSNMSAQDLSGSREVDQSAEVVFDALRNQSTATQNFQQETIGSKTRLVSETTRGDPGWNSNIGGSLPFASSYRVVVETPEPLVSKITHTVDNDAIISSSTIRIEPLGNGGSRVHYSVEPTSGRMAAKYSAFVELCQFAGTLGFLGSMNPSRSDSEKSEEKQAVNRCNAEGRALR